MSALANWQSAIVTHPRPLLRGVTQIVAAKTLAQALVYSGIYVAAVAAAAAAAAF